MNSPKYIRSEWLTEYYKYHRSICINLNEMIWNISFLKKAKEAQEIGAPCRNDYVIRRLFRNEFELLILRLCKTFFDEGADAITLPHLKNRLFSRYLVPEKREEFRQRLLDCKWDSDEIIAARRRLEENVPVFRTHYIAHTLNEDTAELTVSVFDIEKVIVAACDYFLRMSFDIDDLYVGVDRTSLNFQEEKSATENFSESFFLYQQTSAWCIKGITCNYVEDEVSDVVYARIEQINEQISDKL